MLFVYVIYYLITTFNSLIALTVSERGCLSASLVKSWVISLNVSSFTITPTLLSLH
jgi:hypothetical protein